MSTVYRKQHLNSVLPFEGYESGYLCVFYTQPAQDLLKN